MLEVFNSNFFSAMFGAIAGALVAYWLGHREETERRLRDEIAACNVAIGLCAALASTYLSIKAQRLKPMIEHYAAQCVALFVHEISGQQGVPILGLDLESLAPPWTAISALNNIISERVLTAFEPAALAATLTLDVHNQQHVAELRNELVEQYRDCSKEERFLRYFGRPLPSGIVDRNYPDTMHGLFIYTDDCLYRATLLSDVLSAHGRHLALRLGKKAPTVKQYKVDDRYKGMLPNPKNYKSYEAQYRPKKSIDVVVM